MILQYLKKKENDQKKKAQNIYLKIIKEVNNFSQKSIFPLKNEFNTSFELTVILFFIIFSINKKYKKNINQFLMDIFIDDLDFSFRNMGIGDMSIAKYVKKHVKKIYFRFNKLEKIFKKNNFVDFKMFISKISILESKEKDQEFCYYLYNYIKNNLKKSKLHERSKFLFIDPL